MANPTGQVPPAPPNPEVPAVRFSMGLVEISALATVLGATSAEALSVGGRGVAGLPWAVMSTFGLIFVIKSTFAAAISDRVRETLGLRNATVDSVVGLDIPIDTQRPAPATLTANTTGVQGLWVRHRESDDYDDINHSEVREVRELRAASAKPTGPNEQYAVFSFDRTISAMLAAVPSQKTDAPKSLPVYRLRQSGLKRPAPKKIFSAASFTEVAFVDWISIGVSFIKLGEMYTLWFLGSSALWWTTGLCWILAVVASVALRLAGLSYDQLGTETRDFITGELPTAVHPGGVGKITLGLPLNVRRDRLWRLVWVSQSILAVIVLISIFVNLVNQPARVVYCWVGFQAAWLIARMAFYQMFSAPADVSSITQYQGAVMVPQLWEAALPTTRRRIAKLLLALASHIITIHPRGSFAYRHDLVSLSQIYALYSLVRGRLTPELPSASADQIKIIGMVGDPTFRAVNWLGGDLDSMEIYDSILLFAEIKGVPYAVPSVRVLADISRAMLGDDPEAKFASFDPRGMTNMGLVRWVYWIPTTPDPENGDRNWLEVQSDDITQNFNPTPLTQKGLQSFLSRGVLNISLSTEWEVYAVRETARAASGALFQLLSDL